MADPSKSNKRRGSTMLGLCHCSGICNDHFIVKLLLNVSEYEVMANIGDITFLDLFVY